MSRRKLGSRDVTTATRRLAGLKAIDPALDLDNALTVGGYEVLIQALMQKIETYNSLLSTLDALKSEIQVDEEALRHLSEKMLIGVACKFGKDSYEYKKAGGVRKSERKRPKPSPKEPQAIPKTADRSTSGFSQ